MVYASFVGNEKQSDCDVSAVFAPPMERDSAGCAQSNPLATDIENL
jgi:hypothetical protein